jgi:translation initiation factor IF-2
MTAKSHTKKEGAVQTETVRPPVVAIMGHIDHGKSTLLDYIRKANIVASETGGITQHLGAYEVEYQEKKGGPARKITFLDTPGHAAFGGIRQRSASIADVAILIISGEEGVKPQTIEALAQIKDAKVPFIVAITKIDSPKASVERTKQSLAEYEIYVDGYGGDISTVPVSAKTGEGIPELLELVLLTADMANLTANPLAPAEGFIIEAHRDPRRGNATTIVLKNGTLTTGSWLVCGNATLPVRFIENDKGVQVPSATFSAPVRVIGWPTIPAIGSTVHAYTSRKMAKDAAVIATEATKIRAILEKNAEDTKLPIYLVVKGDTGGSVEAIVGELKKITHERAKIVVADAGIGDITENDLKTAATHPQSMIVGFNVKIGKSLVEQAERQSTPVNSYDIIYKLTEAVETLIHDRAPKQDVEETSGKARIIKVFSANKDKQIIGGKVESGTLTTGATVRIIRRDAEIGRGKIRGLEQNKAKASEVEVGREFGTMIEAKIAIAPGDYIESYTTTQQ